MQYSKPNLTEDDVRSAVSVLLSGQIDPAEHHNQFRTLLAELWGVPRNWILLTNSCTTALHIALMHVAGKGKFHAPVLTWPSTYCTRSGYELGDVHLGTGLLRPPRSAEPLVLVALWGRHLTGDDLAGFKGPVIVDSAQDLGRSYATEMSGGAVAAVCYSFGPLKEITTLRGGALVAPWARRYEAFIDSGSVGRLVVESHGFNGQLTEHGAALGLSQLKRFSEDRAHRKALLDRYNKRLELKTHSDTHSGHLAIYRTRAELRPLLRAHLANVGIPTGLHYALPRWVDADEYPNARHLADRVVTLPCHTGVTLDDVDRVCDEIELAEELWN